LVLVCAFQLLHFRFKRFLLASSSSQAKKKTHTHTHKEKKNHREFLKYKKGRELTFKLLLCPLTFGSHLCPPAFALPFQVFSLGIFFFSSRRGKKKHKGKKKP